MKKSVRKYLIKMFIRAAIEARCKEYNSVGEKLPSDDDLFYDAKEQLKSMSDDDWEQYLTDLADRAA